jgi:tricorn protease
MTFSKLARTAIQIMILALVAPLALGAENALWLRAAAISPDGRTVAFSYRGDIWSVPATGGAATPLTVHAAYDTTPVWSPDGRRIAFASDRYGNFDVFVMPATGGEAQRLTFHSSDDTPTSFTPDGKGVLFSSARLDARPTCSSRPARSPSSTASSCRGGMPVQVLSTPAIHACGTGGRAARVLRPEGLRDGVAQARQLVLRPRRVDLGEEDQHAPPPHRRRRRPPAGVGARRERSTLPLREERQLQRLALDLADPTRPVQVTTHAVHPVRFLSASPPATSATPSTARSGSARPAPREPQARRVRCSRRPRPGCRPGQSVRRDHEFELSPDGKEIAFVARGEVFVASVEHGTTRRITDTPGQERSVSFSPDGKSLLYAGERDGSWNVYRTDRTDPEEPAFFNATALKETAVVATSAEEFQPAFSPDGKEVAYLEERTTLKVINLASGKSRTVLPGDLNYSYADGDQWYEWSPDGKTFAVQFLSPTRWSYEVGLVDPPAASESST